MWRKIKIGIAIYVILNVILAWAYWHRIDQYLRFMPSIAAPEFPKPKSKLEAQTQDLTYLKTIPKYDRSFSVTEEKAFQQKIAGLLETKEALSDAGFYLAVREAMALADNGHTVADQSPAFRSFNRAGMDPYWFSDGLFVVRAHGKNAGLLGNRIVAIEGKPVAELEKLLARYTGGAASWRRLASLYFMRSPELLHAANLAASPDKLQVTVADDGGIERTVTLDALPSSNDSEFYYRHPFLTLAPMPLKDEASDWVSSLNEQKQYVAPYLKDIFAVHQASAAKGQLYVRSNYLMESPENPVKKQLLDSLAKAPESGFETIIVDLRWNPGGDYENAVPFAKAAPVALAKDGKIYVIVGPNSFSAAIVFAALLKQYGGDRTILLGETMGDYARFWAESSGPFMLPNSGYRISYATGYHDWAKGCADSHEYCFTPNHRYEADIGDLDLDIAVAPSWKEYAAGRDVVMERIMREATKKGTTR